MPARTNSTLAAANVDEPESAASPLTTQARAEALVTQLAPADVEGLIITYFSNGGEHTIRLAYHPDGLGAPRTVTFTTRNAASLPSHAQIFAAARLFEARSP